MEKIIKMVPSFDIKVGENDSINLNVWELTVVQLWLIMANKTPEAKPLFLRRKKFARREGDLFSFEDVYCTLNQGQVIDIINAIYNLTNSESNAIHMLGTHYPKADSWQSFIDAVDVKETMSGSFIGFWREDTRQSILPVQLRWSEDLGTWYGIKGFSYHGVEFKFKDLSFAQI